jgi:parvulin-like peptidyl-prolyl isomerase
MSLTKKIFVAVLLVGCSRQPPPAHPEVVATVNGVPINEHDVQVRLRADGHGGGGERRTVVDGIIREQLISARARELGLDKDPGYLETLRAYQAQLAALERHELSELYFRREIAGKVTVSPDEARAYFDSNRVRIASDVHVLQIFVRGEQELHEAQAKLDAGASFESVARDLGWMKWVQVPESWRAVVYTMKPGEVSGVLKGPKDRYWIIKLVDRRQDDSVTFESVQAQLTDAVKSEKIEALRARTDRELREQARIEYAE